MAKSPKTAAARSAERLGGYSKPAAFDADEQAIQAEFAGLDLTAEEQADLGHALRLRLGNHAEQLAARSMLARLRQGLAQALRTTLAEQGATSEAMPKSDALRIIGRDGLYEAHLRGKLSTRQLAGGLAFRLRHEAAAAGLRSALDERTGAPLTPEQIVAGKARRAKWEVQRVDVEQLVVDRCGSPALVLLRAVAGEARAVSTQLHASARSAADYERAYKLLCLALDLCADRLPQA